MPKRILLLCLPLLSSLSLHSQDVQAARVMLDRALHLADLYNWDDARADFASAEKAFLTAGDERNALYARLGRIRSTVDQRSLPATAAELASELENNPLLQSDKQLRLFCLIVKGDIDGEVNVGALHDDWQQVQDLASQLGDKKWQYRALAQLGVAAFYNGDLATAGKNVATALAAATQNGDAPAEVEFLTALGVGMRESHMYDEALGYFDRALKVADTVPDIGYPFFTKETLLESLIDLQRAPAAKQLAGELLVQARQRRRPLAEAIALADQARIALQQNDPADALHSLEQSMVILQTGGFVRNLADAQALASNIYKTRGDLVKAAEFADLAAASSQESGNIWSVPQRLGAVANIDIDQGKYQDADLVFDRAEAFVDALIGNYSSVLEKTAIIRSSGELYAQHFALVAERLTNPAKAFAIIEQVRGRVMTDLLTAGAVASPQAKKDQRTISQLRLRLVGARSTGEIRRIRDQIFMVEQQSLITPEISILKSKSHELISLETLQKSLGPAAVLLEYVVSDPSSYCLAISNGEAEIVPLPRKHTIDGLVAAYLKAAKAKSPARTEARRLYDALLAPIPATLRKTDLIVVRDGPLHLVPFDALVNKGGHYVAESNTVIYEPSATSFYLLRSSERRRPSQHALLAIGGIPYNAGDLREASTTRGYDPGSLSDLPASKDEVLAAEAAIPGPGDVLLIGSAGTEAAFKRTAATQFGIIHLAVHGYASTVERNRSALVLLRDSAAGEDGFLQASEIVQLPIRANLVVLSACDTAIGPVEGEEGIAALSQAFLLAGARSVVSTLWSIDDAFSLYLMRQFYKHLAAHETAATALTKAKRDILTKFGAAAVPYYWAAYTVEGAANIRVNSHE